MNKKVSEAVYSVDDEQPLLAAQIPRRSVRQKIHTMLSPWTVNLTARTTQTVSKNKVCAASASPSITKLSNPPAVTRISDDSDDNISTSALPNNTDNMNDDGTAKSPTNVWWEQARWNILPLPVWDCGNVLDQWTGDNEAHVCRVSEQQSRHEDKKEYDDEPVSIMGIARLCPPEQVSSSLGRMILLNATNSDGNKKSQTATVSKNSNGDVSLSQRQNHDSAILSRTYEEIEVTSDHHVQVRLPPTHPKCHADDPTTAVDIISIHKQQRNNKSPSNSTTMYMNSKRNLPASASIVQVVHSAMASSPSQLSKSNAIPVEEFTVKSDELNDLERSISELTMRSSYAATELLQKMPTNRRMAYYAVGKHHKSTGGNRRCYFTGKLILGGMPFYAGTVLQGLRTLVVFCLPSAIGLPEPEVLLKHNLATLQAARTTSSACTTGSDDPNQKHSTGGPKLLLPKSTTSGSSCRSTSMTGIDQQRRSSFSGHLTSKQRRCVSSVSGSTHSHASKSISKVSSSLDSLSIEGELDANWRLDREFLLSVLPPASPELLEKVARLYPEQFETLPMQVRDPRRWRLYVKFCFFSGLPISEGEMHYKVRDEIAEAVYGEEIVLSHDVMEAATGSSSAEILTLPNRTVIRYLRKHYSQQCSKLDDRVFQRSSWERVAPEI